MRNRSIDLFKYISSLFVIGIHVPPFQNINPIIDFLLTDILFRLAVPFFSVCTGYYITKQTNKQKKTIDVIKNQEKKLIKIYATWTFFYFLLGIPFAIKGGYFTIRNYIGYIFVSFTKGSYFHLWYLIGMIYAVLLFLLCLVVLRKMRKTVFVLLMIGLYLIKVLSYGYVKWLPEEIKSCFNVFHRFDALFNAIFLFLPFLLLGFFIANGCLPKQKICLFGFCICILFLSAEATGLKLFGQEKVSYIFFTLPTAFFLFSLLVQLKGFNKLRISNVLGSLSIFIYCFHPMVLLFLPNDMFPMLKYLFVVLISNIMAIVCYKIKKVKRDSITSKVNETEK